MYTERNSVLNLIPLVYTKIKDFLYTVKVNESECDSIFLRNYEARSTNSHVHGLANPYTPTGTLVTG